jgi:DNA-binding NarL/FixJ family response regulator
MMTILSSEAESFESMDVVILAENRLLREALTKFLQKENIRVIATCSLGSNTVNQIAEAKPHVLILDPTGLLSSYAQAILESIKAVPGLKVVLIGMEADEITFLRLVRTGIAGYLLKDASVADVVAAARAVCEGKAVCPPKLCRTLFDWLAHQELPMSTLNGKLQLALTRREMQILQIIGCGCTNKEIALQLHLSEQTVKNHVHRMLHKLGADNRLKALELFHVRGLNGNAVALEEQTDPDTSTVIARHAHPASLYRN